jgi:mannosyl-oligosaccharide glucosidase
VPDEFVTQRVDIANPPTLLLAVRGLAGLLTVTAVAPPADGSSSDAPAAAAAAAAAAVSLRRDVRVFLAQALPSLRRWVAWLQASQRGSAFAPGSFRWRGRAAGDSSKLVPNTLASGLDDYPRSALPSEGERHVDLHCWQVLAVQVLGELEEVLEVPPESRGRVRLLSDEPEGAGVGAGAGAGAERSMSYQEATAYLRRRLFELHWFSNSSSSDSSGSGGDGAHGGRFADVGLAGTGDRIAPHLAVQCSSSGGRDMRAGYMPTEQVMRLHKEASARGAQADLSSACPPSHPQFLYPLGDGRGGYLIRDRYMLGTDVRQVPLEHDGYLTLFPFLLRLLEPAAAAAECDGCNATQQQQQQQQQQRQQQQEEAAFLYSLSLMEQPQHLWTPYGLRSISSTDVFYQRGNAANDAPYWRGPIWLPINHLALGALRHYGWGQSASADSAKVVTLPLPLPPGPLRTRVRRLYRRLRSAVVRNVLDEYHRTGVLWEQYDDRTGQGIRGHPFTGWTALVVNMMAERY